MRKLLLFLLIIPCLSFGIAEAQQKLSLSDAIRKGLDNNYQIKISDKRVDIAKNNNNQGIAGRYPSITLGVNQNNRYDNSESRTVADDRDKLLTNAVHPNLNIRWTIFNGFGVNITKQRLELIENLSEGNAVLIIENSVQAIILAYYKVQLEKEKLQVLQTVKNLSKDRNNYVMAKKELGSSVTYDVLQAKNSFLSDSSNYLLQQLNLKNAYLNLNLLLGEEEGIEYELTDDIYAISNEYTLGDLKTKMFANNKTLRNQYINQELLKRDVAFQKSALYPIISLNSGADYFKTRSKFSGLSATNTYSYDFYANITASFNLFNGGRTRKAIQNAQIEEQVGELSIAEIKQQLNNVLLNLYDLYAIRKQLYDVSLANLESASLNLQISEEKYKTGAINSFNYRDIQLLYLNAAIQKYESMFNLIETHTELLRITGGILEEL